MKKVILAAALAACVLLSGCAALLARSYSLVEPYTDRYWDSNDEDTLRVDNYQDLVNSLVMLIEQRAEEAVIRCYGEVGSYTEASRARSEVRWETMKGAYLLENIWFEMEEGANYSTLSFTMSYREDAEDLASVMTLSDSQSLVDLLRLAVREDHEKLTAQFTFDTPRETVSAAVESFWQELCREEMAEEAAEAAALEMVEAEVPPEEEDGEGSEEESEEPTEEPSEDISEPEEAEPASEDGEEPVEPVSGEAEGIAEPEPEPIDYPPCPWLIRFYPNRGPAELVEILLRES